MRRIYLDYNATAPIMPAVRDAMLAACDRTHGNPSSVHAEGRLARAALTRAREALAALLSVHPGEVVFTSGGTEANWLALTGMVRPTASRPPRLILSAIEHPSTLDAAEALAARGCELQHVRVDASGRVDLTHLEALLTAETALVSIMAANNESGTIQPIQAIAECVHARGIPLHVDAVQAVGKLPVDVPAWQADLLSCSAHKFGGPPGVGALIIRDTVRFTPPIAGHQESARRPGTENLPGIVGFGVAASEVAKHMAADLTRVTACRDRFEAALRTALPPLRVLAADAPRLGNTSLMLLPGVDGRAVVMNLDLEGVAAATGSACSSGSLEPSHVVLAMGVSLEEARSVVRFSLGRETTLEEINAAVTVTADVVRRLSFLEVVGQGPLRAV